MTSSAPAVKAALKAQLATLFPPPVVVSYGLPGAHIPDEIIVVGDQNVEVGRPTMGTARSREEVVETVVTVSIYRTGDETVQQVATERAWEVFDSLSQWFRTKPNETLGGACREAWVTSGALVESVVHEQGTEDGDDLYPMGRAADLTVVVTSLNRR